MIDDIISYGGSLYYSAKALKERGVDKFMLMHHIPKIQFLIEKKEH